MLPIARCLAVNLTHLHSNYYFSNSPIKFITVFTMSYATGGAGRTTDGASGSAGEAQRKANDMKKSLRMYATEIDNLFRQV